MTANGLSAKWRERALYLISPIALLLLWELLIRNGIGDRRFIPAPTDIAERFMRLIVSGDFMWMKDIAFTLKQRLGKRADKAPTKELPDWIVKVGANFSPALNTLKPLLHRSHRFSSDKARRVIGLTTRPAADTVTECAESLLDP